LANSWKTYSKKKQMREGTVFAVETSVTVEKFIGWSNPLVVTEGPPEEKPNSYYDAALKLVTDGGRR
jgi:hypothetical protein